MNRIDPGRAIPKNTQAARRPRRLVLRKMLLIAVSSHGDEGHELLFKLCLDSE